MAQSETLLLAQRLEYSVWQAVMANDGDKLASLFSDDYMEITLEGKRVLKGQVVDESPHSDHITGYSIAQASVLELSKTALLLSYHVTIDGTFLGEPISPRQRWATSIWRQQDSHWKCCFFQQSHYAAKQSKE